MKIASTGREIQRSEFVDSLYNNLRKKTAQKIEDHKKLILMASNYVRDGLDADECAELLMIEENLSREAATGYVNMAKELKPENHNEQFEYSFQFEDVGGKSWSSHDIGKVVLASSDTEAWEKAEEILEESTTVEGDRILSVNRI